MQDPPITPAAEVDTSPGSGYMREAAVQDNLLDRKLTAIRQQQDTGSISTRQAADKRIEAMEHHLEATRALRVAHFGSGGPPS